MRMRSRNWQAVSFPWGNLLIVGLYFTTLTWLA